MLILCSGLKIIGMLLLMIFFHFLYIIINCQMVFIALIGILYFIIGASVCLLICVNPRDPGILGKMRGFVFESLPDLFSSFIRRIFGERVLGWLGGVKYYLLETNHPLVQWFYFLIAVAGFIAYAIKGIFKHMPNQVITTPYVVLAYILASVCFWIYYKACSVSPGQVTKQSQKQYVKKYEDYYDGVLYKKNNKCETCKTLKPARSKHCSVCKMCVSKFDHHCIWIRQCVGQKNYKYFVSFLFLHSVWCSYLSVIGGISLYQSLIRMRFWDRTFTIGGQAVKANNLVAMQYVFVMETMFFFLIVMCAIMGITLFIFVSYHFYLISQNTTTNERVKKNDYIDYLHKQKKRIQKIRNQNPQLPKQISFQGQKMPKKQFQEYTEDVHKRLAILEKTRANPGFIQNMKIVFSQPDD